MRKPNNKLWKNKFDELFLCDDRTMNKYERDEIIKFIEDLLAQQKKQIKQFVMENRYGYDDITDLGYIGLDRLLNELK